DLVHPGLVHVEPDVGLWRHESVELERDALLGKAHQGGCAQSDGGTGLEQGSALDHGRDLLRLFKKGVVVPVAPKLGNCCTSGKRSNPETGPRGAKKLTM